MSLDRRLEILLEPAQYEQLEQAARQSGGSVASIIRDAVDRYVPGDAVARSTVADFLLSAPEIDVGDWSETKRRMHDEMAAQIET